MKKQINKRLLAVVLTLVLCATLMLPGFAAVKPTDSVNHTHKWIGNGDPTTTYAYENPSYHTVAISTPVRCSVQGCDEKGNLVTTSHEAHNGAYCTLCRHYIITNVDDTYDD